MVSVWGMVVHGKKYSMMIQVFCYNKIMGKTTALHFIIDGLVYLKKIHLTPSEVLYNVISNDINIVKLPRSRERPKACYWFRM